MNPRTCTLNCMPVQGSDAYGLYLGINARFCRNETSRFRLAAALRSCPWYLQLEKLSNVALHPWILTVPFLLPVRLGIILNTGLLQMKDRPIYLSLLPTSRWCAQSGKRSNCTMNHTLYIIPSSKEVPSLGSGCPPHTTVSPVTKQSMNFPF